MAEEQGGYTKYVPGDIHHFKSGETIYEALFRKYEVTLDNYGFIIDVWDPKTKTIKDPNSLITVGNRETTYTMPEATKPYKEMTLEELQAAMVALKGDIKVEKHAVSYMYKSMSRKNAKMRDLGREIQKKTQPEKEGYRYRYYNPRPLKHYVTGRSYIPYAYTRGIFGYSS